MAPLIADFTLTFEEFKEAYEIQRQRKRFLTGPPAQSPWVGCAVIAGIFLLTGVLLVIAIVMTGKRVPLPGGATQLEADNPIVRFLWFMLWWQIGAAIFWLVLARFTIERRTLRWTIVMFMLVSTVIGLTSAFTSPAAPPSTQPVDTGETLLAYLPAIIALFAMFVLMKMILARSPYVAWEAQPQMRQPHRIEATPQRLIVQTPLWRTEYTWPAIISFSEGERVFVLSLSAVGYETVAKRGFADPSQVEQFRMLLQSRTLNADAQAQGFPVVPAPAPVPLPPPPLTTQ